MRSILTLVFCMVLVNPARAQSGTITGIVTSQREPVPNAPVQARNTITGASFRTVSSATGDYSLPRLPAGTYDVSVRMPGFKHGPFLRAGVSLVANQTVRVDISLEITNFDTIADDPFTYQANIRARTARLTGPVPRTVGGRPDLSGMWNGNDDLYPEDPELLPWAAAKLKTTLQNDLKDLPRGQCLPAGVLPTGPFFRKFVQTPTLLVMLSEDDVLGFRQVFLDGRAHPKDLDPTWLGHATGRWDRDTLVVDVVGFNEKSVMGFARHTSQLRVTERYRRRDFGHMEVQVVADDPGTLSKPWTLNMVWDLAPDQELLEFLCTENIKNMHLDWNGVTAAR